MKSYIGGEVNMLAKMKKFVMEEEGQGMAEYGLILAGVAVVAVVAFYTLGNEIKDFMGKITDSLTTKPE